MTQMCHNLTFPGPSCRPGQIFIVQNGWYRYYSTIVLHVLCSTRTSRRNSIVKDLAGNVEMDQRSMSAPFFYHLLWCGYMSEVLRKLRQYRFYFSNKRVFFNRAIKVSNQLSAANKSNISSGKLGEQTLISLAFLHFAREGWVAPKVRMRKLAACPSFSIFIFTTMAKIPCLLVVSPVLHFLSYHLAKDMPFVHRIIFRSASNSSVPPARP